MVESNLSRLIVEDNKDILDTMKKMMNLNYGLPPYFATEINEAYELFIKHKPNIVLMDRGLPLNSHGEILLDQLISYSKNNSLYTKIMVYSGNLLEYEPPEGVILLQKPVNPNELFSIIDQFQVLN